MYLIYPELFRFEHKNFYIRLDICQGENKGITQITTYMYAKDFMKGVLLRFPSQAKRSFSL